MPGVIAASRTGRCRARGRRRRHTADAPRRLSSTTPQPVRHRAGIHPKTRIFHAYAGMLAPGLVLRRRATRRRSALNRSISSSRCRSWPRPSGCRRGPRELRPASASAPRRVPVDAVVVSGSMTISALTASMPFASNAALTASKLSGGVMTAKASPSSRHVVAPASSTISIRASSPILLFSTRDHPLLVEHPADAAAAPRLPPCFSKILRISATVRLRLSVMPDGHDRHAARPVALVDDLLVSDALQLAGALLDGAVDVVVRHAVLGAPSARAVRSRGLALMSPPPSRAATVISLISLVNSLPRLASFAAFLCLIELHLEWPDIVSSREQIGGRSELPQSQEGVNGGDRLSFAPVPLPASCIDLNHEGHEDHEEDQKKGILPS